jgi:hypothetical protein
MGVLRLVFVKLTSHVLAPISSGAKFCGRNPKIEAAVESKVSKSMRPGAPGNGWTDPTDPNNSIGSPNEYSCAVYFSENGSASSNDSIVSGRADWNAGASDPMNLGRWTAEGGCPQKATAR